MRTISLNIIGKGTIGKALLRQIVSGQDRFAKQGLELRVTSVIGRKYFMFRQEGIASAELRSLSDGAPLEELQGVKKNHGWKDVTRELRSLGATQKIIVDMTAEPISSVHDEWLNAGWSVVTANKKPLTGSALLSHREHYRYEATVGAGLPVIGSIRGMLDTGDEIQEIVGMMSGTIGYIFTACGRGERFSDAVRAAKEQGFTEPDPRDDLSGTDIARKSLILAREVGYSASLDDVPVETLVPESLSTCSVDTFLEQLQDESGGINARFEKARSNGNVLRYLARIQNDGISIGIREVSGEDPFAGIDGSENMFLIRSKRYHEIPLVIRGPGAGAEVTAAGVLCDIFGLIHENAVQYYEKEKA